MAIAYAQLGGEIRAIDRYGIAFRTLRSRPKGLLEVSVNVVDPRQRQQTLAAVASVVESINEKDAPLRTHVQSITASTKDSIVLDLTKGRTVTWGSAGNAERKLAVLNSLLRISAKQYDVSAPDQPTTRKSEAGAAVPRAHSQSRVALDRPACSPAIGLRCRRSGKRGVSR